MRRVISVIVLNEHSVLSRVSGLFAGRGYNIESLTVAPIPVSKFSRITLATIGTDKKVFEQITKQLNKLVPVLKVIEKDNLIEKEMVLVKVPFHKSCIHLETICKTYNGSIVETSAESIVFMVVDNTNRVTQFIESIKNRCKPIEIVRGGSVSIER